MKRIIALATFALVFAALAPAHADDKEAKKEAPAAVTLTGEIVDTGCYLGHGAMGADHKSCATRCIAGGMPMGLLVEDTVYLLTMSHENADPYNQAKDMAAEMVEVTGHVHERGGMKSIEVDAIQLKAPKKS